MNELYEKQEDGSLKQLEYPPILVKQVRVYQWLRGIGLDLDEIKFLCGGGVNPFLIQDGEPHQK